MNLEITTNIESGEEKIVNIIMNKMCYTCSIAYLSFSTWYTVIAANRLPLLENLTRSRWTAVTAYGHRHLMHT